MVGLIEFFVSWIALLAYFTFLLNQFFFKNYYFFGLISCLSTFLLFLLRALSFFSFFLLIISNFFCSSLRNKTFARVYRPFVRTFFATEPLKRSKPTKLFAIRDPNKILPLSSCVSLAKLDWDRRCCSHHKRDRCIRNNLKETINYFAEAAAAENIVSCRVFFASWQISELIGNNECCQNSAKEKK